ncbi:MAG TPA: AzlC family ABC transporter permease [Symbiobacteriaceae bacterium]|nr:AzlC family ABC transporter permease [Symbiobacteriaceae bacterium]
MEWNIRRVGTGLRDGLTFVPSVAILGAIFGASSRAVGISPWVATAMSIFVWSGSGQFAALPLWHTNGLLVGLSTLVLSLRFSLMTASMAPRLAGAPLWLRALLAFGITDENYALVISRRSGQMEPDYLAGSFVPIYIPWIAGTAAGAFFAAQVPAAWTGPLNAVFPIVFLALAVLCSTTRPAAVVAVLGAILAVAGRLYLPGGWYVIVAGLLASLAGPLLERLLPGEERA